VRVIVPQRTTDDAAGAGRPRSEGVPERLVVIAFVAGETFDFLGVSKGDSTTSLGVVRPVCRAVRIEDGTRICIDECRRFECTYVAIRAVLGMSRCRFPVEECGIDGTVRVRIADGRGLTKEAPATRTWVLSQTIGTALRVREMPFERAVTAHEPDPFHSPNPRSRSTSHPCEPATSGM